MRIDENEKSCSYVVCQKAAVPGFKMASPQCRTVLVSEWKPGEPVWTGNDRTAVLLQIPHEPGSLYEALNAFKKNGINLTWIESFPLHGPESGYQFFLDFEGHASQPAVQKTLAELEKRAVRMELLGSYPKGKVFA